VYSCGGLIHDGRLWLAYGMSDQRTAFASTDLHVLLERLHYSADSADPRRLDAAEPRPAF
jgi:predicted GH43/DUF377 family glycosyl hydrolase